MVSKNTQSVAEEAKRIYEKRMRVMLEKSHMNEFVAIEPVSGEYFLGATLSEAIGASRSKYPDRLAHAMRVGHKAAIHFGMQIR
jgi:aspartate/methionine/tyrosine aminotransferase